MLALAAVASLFELKIELVQFFFGRFYLLENFVRFATVTVSMARDDLALSKALLKHLLYLRRDNFGANLRVDPADENGVFGNKLVDELLGGRELGIAHFVAEASEERIGDNRVQEC